MGKQLLKITAKNCRRRSFTDGTSESWNKKTIHELHLWMNKQRILGEKQKVLIEIDYKGGW